MEIKEYIEYCYDLKRGMFYLLKNGKSGHIGGSLSIIEVLATVYNEFIKGTNNKLVFSKGHCELAIYSLFLKENILDNTLYDQLKLFGSKLQGHPNHCWIHELDYSSGSLGQGLSFALGLAICGKEDNYQVFVLLGDGELQEGQIWEAIISAPRFGVSNLNVIVDCNRLQLEGSTLSTGNAEKMSAIWKKWGWNTKVIADGHNIKQLLTGLYIQVNENSPSVYFIKTVKGHGISYMENNSDYHGKNLSKKQIEQALNEIKKRK